MNIMKKRSIFVFFCIVFLGIPFAHATAWNNGNSGSAYAYNKSDYSYEDNYTTHDWIAEYALDELMKTSSDWEWLNQPDMKKIFLLGTEAPDNSGVETTLDGEVIEGFGDKSKHHIYFYENGTLLEDDAALLAKKWGDLADARYEEGKKEQTAFYLGAMTHYIADLSMYAHIAQNDEDETYPGIDFDEHHNTVERYVRTRTNEYDNKDDFFKLGSIEISTDKKPYDIAVDMAWETYRDESNNGDHDALWLHENFFSNWVQHYEQRSSDTETNRSYYDRTETLLTLAVESCASAMAYIGGMSKDPIPAYPMWIFGIFFGISVVGVIIITKKKHGNFH
jgi:hypothetical protein